MKEIAAFRAGLDTNKVDPVSSIWLGISVRDMGKDLSETDNPLSFSDKTKVYDSGANMLLNWECEQPVYTETSQKCRYLFYEGKISHDECDFEA